VDASPTQKDEFLKEIDLMKRVSLGKCPNIVNTIGCCTLQEPIALVMEYVPYGNLLGYLRTSRKLRYQSGKMHEEEVAKIGNEYITVNIPSDDPNDWKTLRGDPNLNPYSHLGDLEPANLIKFAFQISSGMEYLSSIGVIHRDLACRNILVGEQKMLKICDFGLARENDLYIKTTAGKLPLRWMAIESITERIFTSKSDVWSFGVTLWEIATLGGCPYPAVTNHSLVDYIWSGNRLEKPNNCSMDVYQVMLQCWKASPDDRPSFMELRCLFEGMVNREKNYIDINDEFLPYYPMSAVCDTTGDSLDAPNGGMVSPTPMDYEIPLVFKQGLTGTQKEDEKHILMNEKTTSKDDTEDLTLHAKNPTFSDLASITSEDNDGNKREQ
jgi:proto-oncogene tyrosine-protein kinase Ret